jgi:hypothetical protein
MARNAIRKAYVDSRASTPTVPIAALLKAEIFDEVLSRQHPIVALSAGVDFITAALWEKQEQPLVVALEESDRRPAYKARPLDGIWATGPFLHNGSVPNLYQLLLPPERRSVEFCAGVREFDPMHVGFVLKNGGCGPGESLLDTRSPGNSNAGHVYGTDLSDEDRWALVEYQKTL